MKLRELIAEEGDAAGTVSADIATVAYPLFVRGKTLRQRQRAARRAVGQTAIATKSYIGKGVYESVIYRVDRDRPMTNTEVLVLGGAGRYTLDGLRQKARREAAALVKELEPDSNGSFRNAAVYIKQLVNTLNTIVAAYDELKAIRSKGGKNSRGITAEDLAYATQFRKELENWAARSRLAEDGDSSENENDSVKRPGQLISWPTGTTMVDVSDVYDWYKLGMAITNLGEYEPRDFHSGAPHTIFVFGSEDEEHKYVPQLKNLEFDVHDIDRASDIVKAKKDIHDSDKKTTESVSEAKTLDKNTVDSVSGMYHLGMSPGYDFYRFSVHIAGNQGGYETGLGTEAGPFAYAFTVEEEKMIKDAVKAVGGNLKRLTPQGSRESKGVNKTSPVASTAWKKELG